MEIEQQILEVIQKQNYRGLDVKHLARILGMEDSESFILLCKELNRLEEQSILYTDPAHRYFTGEQMGYFTGNLKINPKGFGFVEAEDTSVYISRDSLGLAMHNDKVVARVWENMDGTHEGEIIKIIEHNTKLVVGTIKKKEGKTFFLPDAFMNNRRFKITNLDEYRLVNDSKVLVHIDRYDATISAHIEKEVGFKYDPGVDVLSILYEHDIWPDFPESVLKEITKIPDHVVENDKVGRRSLLDKQIITIDGEDARDLDDAISVEKIEKGYRLGVHIADVSYYVREGMEVNSEAYARGTSVYVTDRVVPMLPHALSNGICSLNPKVERLTLTCMMDIDATGTLMHYEIFPSYIKTVERMTYTKVNEILAKDEDACKEYAHIQELCKNMQALSAIIRRRRVQLGSIDFDTREAKILVDEQGKPTDIVLRERGLAEMMIEDFMIAANETVAAHMKWMEIPSIYRIHETPDPKKMREFARTALSLGYKLKADVNHVYPKQLQEFLKQAKGDDQYPVLSTFMLRSMQKARYDNHCLGHFGLALQEYLHFTSPIRRYPDLIVHRMLHKYYFEQLHDADKMKRDEIWTEECSKQCSERERIAVEAERDVDDMKKAEYMERYIGAKFEGVISGITKFGMFVELDNTVEGLVHVSSLHDDYYHFDDMGKCLIGERTGNKYVMGQKVKVQVMDANRFKKQVDFEIVSKKRVKSPKDTQSVQKEHKKKGKFTPANAQRKQSAQGGAGGKRKR